MLTDARRVPDDTTLEADVCIIGAGAAGISVAREFVGSGTSVLVLESAGFEFDAPTQSLYEGESVGLPLDPQIPVGLDTPRLRYFGGSTNHWAGFCRPFEPTYLDSRAHVPHSGWPFGRDELDRYYPRANDVCAIGDHRYDWRSWNADGVLAPPLLDTESTPSVVTQLTQAPVLAERYRQVLVDASNVNVCIWANVVNLSIDPESDLLSHVEVATLDGNRFQARARAYVLATGGIEVPRLLLASNDVRRAGIGNEHDVVGRFFAEHPSVIGGVAVLSADLGALAAHFPDQNVAATSDGRSVELSVVVTIAEAIARERGLYGTELSILRADPIEDSRLNRFFPRAGDGAELLAALGLPARSMAVVRLLCEQEPNPASRVRLGRERDELGLPRSVLDWRVTADDRASIVRSLEVYGTELARMGLGRLKIDIRSGADDSEPWDGSTDFLVNTGSHHMGTARMHPDARHGVVDADCRVHDVANLYVAGSAVFPTTGPQPPTVTIVALAVRLADHLRSTVLA